MCLTGKTQKITSGEAAVLRRHDQHTSSGPMAREGEEMEETIEETPRGLSLKLCLGLRNGLHARPAARLAQEAQRYASTIQLISDTGEVDAKSMLDILSLAQPANAELTLLAQGQDAREALYGLARLLNTMQD
ncbi:MULTISPECIES: HPr family phosphocarrier protein [Desulfovibrio]|uniref:Phosphocarrier protein n=2 Tax=Desulfovibrio TaxID=872 RepID=A0AA94HR34_DESDE|nr:HPr family phosphocarrier protein [Desulfovibrio desulfuricans]SFW21820.1 phosphocarrier protein [Desulfovibrio desulfuricans]SPD36087.1 Phosphotransferase system, HPr histidine phosphorylation site [Desulfovibrio sp. G11]